MALLTPRQYRLGLGMLAADRRSGLTREERLAALRIVEDDEPIASAWQRQIVGYLRARSAAVAKETSWSAGHVPVIKSTS